MSHWPTDFFFIEHECIYNYFFCVMCGRVCVCVRVRVCVLQSAVSQCVLAPGESDRSSFIPACCWLAEEEVVEEMAVSPEPLPSSEAEEGSDTTMYFCMGRDAARPAPTPASSFTRGCRAEVVLCTVLVPPDWEVLRVITCRSGKIKDHWTNMQSTIEYTNIAINYCSSASYHFTLSTNVLIVSPRPTGCHT